MRQDVNGKELFEGDVVENWQGFRTVLNANLEALYEGKELKTPIIYLGKQDEEISMERTHKPNWHPLNKYLT